VTFTGYIRWFCATTSHDLVTSTFDLLTLRVSYVQCFSCPTHIPIFIILRISVTELRVLNIWSHFRYLKQSLRMRRVTWLLTGGQNSPHFWNSWFQFAYSLCHFQGATTKIKPCYRQKIAFSHYNGYKVYCAWAVSCDLCTSNNFLTQNSLFTIQFLWATMTNRGSFLLEHLHVRAVFGRK